MGIGVGLMFDKDVPGKGTFENFIADGKQFACEMDRLDETCNSIGIAKFSRFCPYDPSDAAVDEESLTGERSEEVWFDPADGMKTVSCLTKSLTSEIDHAKSKRKKLELEGLIAALDALKVDLALAKKAKARFALFLY